MDWTKPSIEAGFQVLHREQFHREGGAAPLNAEDADAELHAAQVDASELRRHVTRQMAETAGHGKTSLAKVIRAKCLDCAGASHEVALCSVLECPCWPYRFGKNPFSSRTGKPGGNPEPLQKAREAKLAAAATLS
jgi:hypothetical protein